MWLIAAIGFLATKPFPFQKYFCTLPSNVLYRHEGGGGVYYTPIMPLGRIGKAQTNEDGGPSSPVYLVPQSHHLWDQPHSFCHDVLAWEGYRVQDSEPWNYFWHRVSKANPGDFNAHDSVSLKHSCSPFTISLLDYGNHLLTDFLPLGLSFLQATLLISARVISMKGNSGDFCPCLLISAPWDLCDVALA